MSKPDSTIIQFVKVSTDASIISMNCAGRLSRSRIEEGIVSGIERLGNAATASVDPHDSAGSRWLGEVILQIEDEVEPRSLHMDPAALEARIIEGAVVKIRDIAGPRGIELCSLKLIAEVKDAGSMGERSIAGCVVGFDLDDSISASEPQLVRTDRTSAARAEQLEEVAAVIREADRMDRAAAASRWGQYGKVRRSSASLGRWEKQLRPS